MALNTFKCNYLTPLHFKGLNNVGYNVFSVQQLSFLSCVCYSDFIRSWLDGSRRLNVSVQQRVKHWIPHSQPASLLMYQSPARQRQGASRHQELGPAVGHHQSPAQHEVALLQVQLHGARLRRWLAQQWEFCHLSGVRLHLSLCLRVVQRHSSNDAALLHQARKTNRQSRVCRLGLPSVDSFRHCQLCRQAAKSRCRDVAAVHCGNAIDCCWSCRPAERNN